MRSSIFYLLVILWAIPIVASAQSRVEILRADRVQSLQTDDGLLRKLTGNVHLRTNDLEVVSDTALHYVDLNEIHGFSSLRIDTQKETIWADKVVYNIQQEISSLTGNVIIETESVSIYSETALYSFLSEIAFFNNPLWLQDQKGTMRAESGIYFNLSDSAVFRGNVQFADSTQYIEADSMFTNRASEYYELYGTVYMQDDENRARLMGNYVESDSTGRRLIEGNAILRRLNKELSDTTWLQAGRINMTKIDTFYIIDAVQDVQIWEVKYASRSDSARYNEQTEQFHLRKSPVVWYEKVQLTGEIIDIQFENDTLKTLLATGEPFSAQLDSLTQRLHQMQGDTIWVYFADGDIERINILENAQMLLHYTDDNDNPDGAIQISAQDIFIFFEDGDVADMNARIGIEGETLPESAELNNRELDRFSWDPELRPVRPEIEMKPRLEPIPDSPPFTRPGVELGFRKKQ